MPIRTSVVLALMLAGLSMAAQAVRLEYKETAGTKRSMSSVLNVKGTIQGGGLVAPFVANTSFVTVETVTAVNNGVANIVTEGRDGKVTLTVSGLPNDQGELESQTIEQAMPGFTFNFQRTPTGRVSNIKFSGDAAKVLGDPTQPWTTSGQFPGQELQFPTGDVQIGDSWDAQQALVLGNTGKADVVARYQLVGSKVIDGRTLMQINGTYTVTVTKMTINMDLFGQKVPMLMDMVMKGTSVSMFDAAAGQLVSETFSANSEMALTSESMSALNATTNMSIEGVSKRIN